MSFFDEVEVEQDESGEDPRVQHFALLSPDPCDQLHSSAHHPPANFSNAFLLLVSFAEFRFYLLFSVLDEQPGEFLVAYCSPSKVKTEETDEDSLESFPSFFHLS